MSIQVFADESGGMGQTKSFAFVGLVAPAEIWVEFSDKWRACLSEPPAIPGPFKLSQAAGRNGPFFGWTEEERDAKVKKLAHIVGKHIYSVHHLDYDLEGHQVVARNRNIGKPLTEYYFWPFHMSIMGMCFYLYEDGLRERFEIVFDEQAVFGPRAKSGTLLLGV